MGIFFKRIKNPKNRRQKYRAGLWIALDQFGGALLGIHPDETISSHLGKCERGDFKYPWWGKPVTFALNKVDPGHCQNAIEDDEGYEEGRLFIGSDL